MIQATYISLLVAISSALALVGANSVPGSEANTNNLAQLDSPALKMVSDDDQRNMQFVRSHIAEEYRELKSIESVHAFLDKVRLLDQKHPKNIAFAQGDLKELHKFLSSEMMNKLRRVDVDPFQMPLSEDKFALAQKAVDEDELTKKLFANPLRNHIESLRKKQMSNHDDGNHRDGNFFTNIWCKVSGTCSNQ